MGRAQTDAALTVPAPMTQTHIGGCGCLRPAATASPPHCLTASLPLLYLTYRSRRAQTAVSLALRRAPARWYSRTGAVSARRAASLARCVARSFSSRVRRLAVRHSECTYMVVLHKYMLKKCTVRDQQFICSRPDRRAHLKRTPSAQCGDCRPVFSPTAPPVAPAKGT